MVSGLGVQGGSEVDTSWGVGGGHMSSLIHKATTQTQEELMMSMSSSWGSARKSAFPCSGQEG
jgi:hypothetical protein